MSDLQNDKKAEGLAADVGKPAARDFYCAVWRWHFYAGLFVVPFMVMLSITGIIYLFKPQLDAVMYGDRLFVAPQTTARSPNAQLKAVEEKYPAARIVAFTPGADAARSAQFEIVTGDNRNLLVFVDPYSARVLGDLDNENNLQAYVVKLHGELLIGTVGDYLVELAACWALVLMISGLYLWFPRTGSKIWGTLLPRLNPKNKRIFWRDLHAVPGFYGTLIVIFMILTGLPWAGFWGESFARVWTRFPADKQRENFKSTAPTAVLNTTADKKVAWAVEQMPLPESSAPSHEHDHSESPESSGRKTAGGIDLDTLAALARTKNIAAGYKIVFPRNDSGVYTISAPTSDPLKEATVHVDRYSGTVLADVRWADYGAVPKAVEMGIALHEGKYFGLPNQLLMLLAALTVLLLALSGAVMWWQRRPSKRLGAPPLPENFPLWKTAVAIIFALGILFPLVGLSLVCALVFDRLVIRRVPALGHFVK